MRFSFTPSAQLTLVQMTILPMLDNMLKLTTEDFRVEFRPHKFKSFRSEIFQSWTSNTFIVKVEVHIRGLIVAVCSHRCSHHYICRQSRTQLGVCSIWEHVTFSSVCSNLAHTETKGFQKPSDVLWKHWRFFQNFLQYTGSLIVRKEDSCYFAFTLFKDPFKVNSVFPDVLIRSHLYYVSCWT